MWDNHDVEAALEERAELEDELRRHGITNIFSKEELAVDAPQIFSKSILDRFDQAPGRNYLLLRNDGSCVCSDSDVRPKEDNNTAPSLVPRRAALARALADLDNTPDAKQIDFCNSQAVLMNPAEGVILQTLRAAKAGDVLLRIPFRVCLCSSELSTFLSGDHIVDANRANRISGLFDEEYDGIDFKLALTVALASLANDPRVRYLEELAPYESLQTNCIFLWAAETSSATPTAEHKPLLERILSGSVAFRRAKTVAAQAAKVFEGLVQQGVLNSSADHKLWLWACAVVQTRGFVCGANDERAICPILDLANHRSGGMHSACFSTPSSRADGFGEAALLKSVEDLDAASSCSTTLGDSTPRDEDSTPRNESVPDDEDAASTCCSTPREVFDPRSAFFPPALSKNTTQRDDDLLILADCALDAGEEITICYDAEADFLDLFERGGFFDASCPVHTVEVEVWAGSGRYKKPPQESAQNFSRFGFSSNLLCDFFLVCDVCDQCVSM